MTYFLREFFYTNDFKLCTRSAEQKESKRVFLLFGSSRPGIFFSISFQLVLSKRLNLILKKLFLDDTKIKNFTSCYKGQLIESVNLNKIIFFKFKILYFKNNNFCSSFSKTCEITEKKMNTAKNGQNRE